MGGRPVISVNGESMKWHPGMTVREILDAKRYTFPMIAVWINGTPVPRDRFDETEVPDGANVQVVHMIGGG
ncbi:MAG TPA: sulfur carrier protein ThiS [Thermosynergistes sp.]|nr:sulfur carrier protein ThiS [Thermosynergistes sp.]HOK19322.1 sulfur carrier protein ThiS [Thermosynergistes sp.]HOM25497.1 sulfur carrier protein ThiS [Thermosynergistes sp.]HPP37145.1 sulfur carrier protein ThiS [Thermosynergistes sp.]HQE20974.1 sulfur carrier protein ThiS [Thermosynergistes sp.]